MPCFTTLAVVSSELPGEHADFIAMLFLAHLCASILEGDLSALEGYPFMRDYTKLLKPGSMTFAELFSDRILPGLEIKLSTLPTHLRSLVLDYAGGL